MSRDHSPTLYERAVDFVQDRHSVSAQNLKAGLGLSDAQAKTFIRIMQDDGVISPPLGVVARHQVISPTRQLAIDNGLNGPIINLDDPEKSVLFGKVLTAEDVLTATAQSALRQIVDRIISIDDEIDELRDNRKVITAAAKATGFSKKVLEAAIKVIRKTGIDKFQTDHELVMVYLHALGEVIDDQVQPPPLTELDPDTRH